MPGAPEPELVAGGSGWVDGKFHAPDGWPEGAGWVVRDPDGTISSWGPAEDFHLVATTATNPEDKPSGDNLQVALKGLPVPEKE